jgi:hypothetical protein
MARPIKETPILQGEDARRFREAIANVQKISDEEREEARQAYKIMKQHSNFYMP